MTLGEMRERAMRLWRNRRVRLGAWAAGLIVLAFAAVAYFSPSERSFVLTGVTRGLEVTMSGTAMNTWRLVSPTLCIRRPALLSAEAAAVVEAGNCDPRAFEEVDIAGPVEFGWRDATRLTISRLGVDEGLSIRIDETPGTPNEIGGNALPAGSRIELGKDEWSRGLILTLAGRLTIGQTPGPGSQLTLISGNYEIREPMPFRERPVVVSSGSLFPGDQATVRNFSGPISGFAFIEAVGKDDAGFAVTAYWPGANGVLSVGRFAAEPIEIQASWIERALADDFLTAVSVLIALVLAIEGLVKLISRLVPRRRRLNAGRDSTSD